MQVTVNSKIQHMAPGSTVADLLEQLQLAGKRIAVEMNGEIVPKSQHASTPLLAGAELEIVVAVGGG
ncbi:sulfur carrier protein ThiS [Limnobacter sp.]|uniref:sulfur carrier protein ThiS n=1 Tax=Limnobacter sp. TaxID=2003368 RepID=UPI0035171F47